MILNIHKQYTNNVYDYIVYNKIAGFKIIKIILLTFTEQYLVDQIRGIMNVVNYNRYLYKLLTILNNLIDIDFECCHDIVLTM